MFQSARIKLTFWYLLIITLITILFSVGIYKITSREFDRVVRIQRLRIENPGFVPPHSFFLSIPSDIPSPRRVDLALLNEAQQRLKLTLIVIDLAIISGSFFAAYFLAGKTLSPIEQMVEEQKRFVADASHELRTPLTVLKSEIEVFLREKNITTKAAKNLLLSNLEEIDKLKSLSDYLLSLSKYQVNSLMLNPANISFLDILAEAIKRTHALAKSKRILMKNEASDFSLNGNSKALTELFIILLDNAIKFSRERGKIIISSETEDSRAKVSITDFGVGISKENLPFIFNRFYQAEESRGVGNGYGLGLAIAERIAYLHKGTIKVDTEVGKGSTFTVTLPTTS